MSPEPGPKGPPRRLADVLLLLALLGLSLKMSQDVSRVVDLGCEDEAFYMLAASEIPARGLPPAEACPCSGSATGSRCSASRTCSPVP